MRLGDEREVGTERAARRLLKSTRRTHGQVVVFRHARQVAAPDDAAIPAHREPYAVGMVDEAEHGL